MSPRKDATSSEFGLVVSNLIQVRICIHIYIYILIYHISMPKTNLESKHGGLVEDFPFPGMFSFRVSSQRAYPSAIPV